MEASTSASAGAASTSKLDDSAASRLKALQDQIAARKRKRADEAAAATVEDVKGKGKAVSFAETEQDAIPSAGVIERDPSSILKPGRTSQEDAFKQSKASVPKAPAKAKTTAKKRYLKNKLERRKARKKAGADAGTSEAGEAKEDGEEEAAAEPEETAEDRKAIKRAKRDERNALRAATALAADQSVRMEDVEAQAVANTSDADAAKATRQAERKARKEAKKMMAEDQTPGNISMQDTELSEAPLSRKEKKQEAIIANMKAAQEKANKKALKAAQKARYRAEALGLTVEELQAQQGEAAAEDLPPTQPDALPRFPAPQQPQAPSQRELDELAISAELKDAVIVDQAKSLAISAYQEAASPASKRLSNASVTRLEEMGIKELFAVQAAVLPILLEQRHLYLPTSPPRDVCVSAPTGSGKTLGYVVPIVEVSF